MMSSSCGAPHLNTIPSKMIVFSGVWDPELAVELLKPLGMIETVSVCPRTKAPLIQFYSAKLTQEILARKSFTFKGHNMSVTSRPGNGLSMGGDIAQIMRSREGVENYCEKLFKYADEAKNDKEEADLNDELIKEIRKCPGLETMTIKRYGSRLQGLQLKGKSDLDVFIGPIENFTELPAHNCADEHKIKQKLWNFLETNSNKFTDIENKTRNIGCTWKSKDGPMPCDFSFENGMGYRTSLFVRRICDSCHVARSMILFLKDWSHATGVRYYFVSYLASLLVFFFLQQKKILPPLKNFIPGMPPVLIGGWETSFKNSVEWPQQSSIKCADLIKEFFDFYNKFDFENQIICVLTGEPIWRDDLTVWRVDPLIANKKALFDKQAMEGYSKTVKMAVMGPFELSANVAHRIGTCPEAYKAVKDLIKKSSDLMSSNWRRI